VLFFILYIYFFIRSVRGAAGAVALAFVFGFLQLQLATATSNWQLATSNQQLATATAFDPRSVSWRQRLCLFICLLWLLLFSMLLPLFLDRCFTVVIIFFFSCHCCCYYYYIFVVFGTLQRF